MPRSLTNYHIKLLAALFMAIDHIGVVLFPDADILRILGRFSFPLFAWLLVEGEKHTSDVRRYGLRLLVLGIISQPIYWLTFESQRLNILFMLLLGLLSLRGSRMFPSWQIIIWLGSAGLATAIGIEYGAYGIALIALIGRFKPDGIWWMSWLLLHLVTWLVLPNLGSFQVPAIFTPLCFSLTNHQRGAKARWFYWFYPVHLLILFFIRAQFF
ncbi:TraX family protein [Egbenema bharatensis]|uniref:TraX family protein n=1 Tax=Egbenema bharatensis TaxID=3463334 RepID=UPI003A847C2E